MPLRNIEGQQIASRLLTNFLSAGRVPHALLFIGPGGCGKRTTALSLAQAVNCPSPVGGDACGVCNVCRRIEKGIDIDVRVFEPTRLGFNREQAVAIREEASITPNTGKKKFLILDFIEKAEPAVTNLMLKIIEEPPEYTVFILLTENQNLVLPTIKSRSIPIPFRPLSVEEAILICRDRIDEKTVRLLFPAAGGNLGAMINLSTDKLIQKLFEDVEEFLDRKLYNNVFSSPSIIAAEIIRLASLIKLKTEGDTESTAERKSIIFVMEIILVLVENRFRDLVSGNRSYGEISMLCRNMDRIMETIKAVKGGGHTQLSLESFAMEFRKASGL